MAKDKSAGSLPTEFIDEKTFYTLGGASAGVLVVCWAINYIAVDVSWMNYKFYRLMGIILSEAFAIIIMFRLKKKSSLKWLFAFLNGILIFINASGLNSITSSYVFNPKDSTAQGKESYFRLAGKRSFQEAGLITLPRMTSWWPDEKLVSQNQQLLKRANSIDSVNYQLRNIIQGFENDKAAKTNGENDSLKNRITSLQQQLDEKQKQIDQLVASSQGSTNELQQQLAECIKSNGRKKDSLIACEATNANWKSDYSKIEQKLKNCDLLLERCNADKTGLNNRINELNQQIAAGNKQMSLTELLKEVCARNNAGIIGRMSRTGNKPSQDDLLRQQDFYKNVNWRVFCQALNNWLNPVVIK